MTKDFCKINVPCCKRSKWVGYSSFLYILPAFFVPGNSIYANLFKISLILQGPISHASDYVWHDQDHFSHGLDRWFATALTTSMIYISLKYYGLFSTILYAFVPIGCLYIAKYASIKNNEKLYNLSQTVWHITSPAVCCFIMNNLKNDGFRF